MALAAREARHQIFEVAHAERPGPSAPSDRPVGLAQCNDRLLPPSGRAAEVTRAAAHAAQMEDGIGGDAGS